MDEKRTYAMIEWRSGVRSVTCDGSMSYKNTNLLCVHIKCTGSFMCKVVPKYLTFIWKSTPQLYL